MTYLGHVEKGVVVLDEANDLPDGTEVRVEAVLRPALAEIFHDEIGCAPDLPDDMVNNHDHYLHGTKKRPTHAELLKDFIGCISDLPEDMADNHDHYLHGKPKR